MLKISINYSLPNASSPYKRDLLFGQTSSASSQERTARTWTSPAVRSILPPLFKIDPTPVLTSSPGAKVSNPGISSDGQYMLYRVANQEDIPHAAKDSVVRHSVFRIAKLNNEGQPNPITEKPLVQLRGYQLKEFPGGIEDPRVSKIDDTYYILGTLVETHRFNHDIPAHLPVQGQYIGLLQGKDLENSKSMQYIGPIGPNRLDKNASLLPSTVKNPHTGNPKSFLLFHQKRPNIAYTFIDDLVALKNPEKRAQFWEKQDAAPFGENDNAILMEPLFEWEQGLHIALSQPPIRIPEDVRKKLNLKDAGWLAIYHSVSMLDPRGVDNYNKKRFYYVGAALLNNEEPWKVVSRSPTPIFSDPEHARIFPSGGRILENSFELFYGVNNEQIKRSSTDLEKLLAYISQFDTQGQLKANLPAEHSWIV